MSLRELKASLRLEAQRVRKIAPSAVWYLFGSVLRAFEAAADIDLLIVFDSDETVARAISFARGMRPPTAASDAGHPVRRSGNWFHRRGGLRSAVSGRFTGDSQTLEEAYER
jgi:hypothetical protein